MPIDYRVESDRRRVMAEGRGTVTAEEIFGYQREVWSRGDVAGFDELVDMSAVERVAEPSSDGMRGLAEMSARTDPPGETRFAIVAPQDSLFGLGRMYEAFRELNPRSTRLVSVFRDRESALRWLDREEPAAGAPSAEPESDPR
jgi:hypothetical protein